MGQQAGLRLGGWRWSAIWVRALKGDVWGCPTMLLVLFFFLLEEEVSGVDDQQQ